MTLLTLMPTGKKTGDEFLERGLYLDLRPGPYHVFDLEVNP